MFRHRLQNERFEVKSAHYLCSVKSYYELDYFTSQNILTSVFNAVLKSQKAITTSSTRGDRKLIRVQTISREIASTSYEAFYWLHMTVERL